MSILQSLRVPRREYSLDSDVNALVAPSWLPETVLNHSEGYTSIRKTPCLLFGAFSTFFMLFMKNVEKAQKSMKKPSPPLARMLSEAVKKVYCFQKYFRSQKYMKVQPKNDK